MAIDISTLKSGKSVGKRKPLSSGSSSQSIWKRDLTYGNVLSAAIKEAFYSELLILISAGLDLKTSLDIITNEQKKQKVRTIFVSISDSILKGATFSESVKKSEEFSVYEYISIKIGEESGRLPEVLEELSAYFQKKLKQQKQLIGALSYPVLILMTAVVAVVFMMNFIVPLFADAFLRFDSDLPELTKTVIAISEGLQKYWLVIPLVLVLIYLSYLMAHKKVWYKRITSIIIFKVPVMGRLLHKIYLARFCQAMALMTGARTPLIQALDLVSKMMGLYSFEIALQEIQQAIHQGKALHEAMSRYSVFESRMVALIKVGEETNRLDSVFKRLYEQYTEESDHQTAMVSAMLEPLMIVLIGGLVAVILIAMYLPMFKLSTTLMGT